ncbi:MAG: DM13 domain-containing protein [Chryseolinea sp.]
MKYFNVLLFVIFAFVSCNSDEDPKPLETEELQEPIITDEAPANSAPTSMGAFTSYAHGLSGKAVIYADASNAQTLRLELFNLTSGPDVYVFLSKSNNYSAANAIPITMLKGSYANNNLTLTLDNSIDLETHKFVLVYCVEFSSLFGFAELE